MGSGRSKLLRIVGCLFLTAGLVACGGDPEGPEPPEESVPTDGGVSASTPKEGGPKVATITGRSADVVVEVKAFPEEVLKLKSGDVVSVRMKRGVTRGTISSVRPKLLTLATEAGATLRLKPAEVQGVKLLFREDPDEISVTGDVPLNEDERWLDRFADRDIIGKSPRDLWTGRFQKNAALTAKASFKLDGLVFVKRRGTRVYFVNDDLLLEVRPKDQIKIVGLAQGYQKKADGTIKELGEIFLYLVRRGRRVRIFYTKQRLVSEDFTKGSLALFMQRQPVTLVANRPGSQSYLKITRIRAKVAQTYKKHLEATPDRAAIRKMRARASRGLRKAEQQVRSMFQAVGLKKDEDFDEALVIAFRVPSDVDGRIELVPYSKEIGLD